MNDQVKEIYYRTLKSGGDDDEAISNWVHEILDHNLGPHDYDPIHFQYKCHELRQRHPGEANDVQYLSKVAGIIESTIKHGKQQGDLFGKEPA